jgi:hypothetical protein
MNAGAINFLIKRFDEQPVLESDLPQIAAGVFQADDGHGGIAGDFARGVRAVHVLVLAYWHHMHAARLFLAFIHGCPLRARSGRSISDFEAASRDI